MTPRPVLAACIVLNGPVALFQPLLAGNPSLPVPVLVTVVVLVDVAVIKLVVALNPFQGDGYHGVSWVRSLFTCGVVDVVVVVVVDVAVRRPLVT